jgi:hypothetical protein
MSQNPSEAIKLAIEILEFLIDSAKDNGNEHDVAKYQKQLDEAKIKYLGLKIEVK